jgi:hypothetical protein
VSLPTRNTETRAHLGTLILHVLLS